MALYAVHALIIYKKIVLHPDRIDCLLNKLNSKNLGSYEAAIQILVSCSSSIEQEKIEKKWMPFLLEKLKNEDKYIQIVTLDGIMQLETFVSSEMFTTHIYPVLWSNLESKTDKFYETTLFSIQTFKRHLSFLQQKECVTVLVKHIVDTENPHHCFQQLLMALSHFFICISEEQHALLKKATTFQMPSALNSKERKQLREKIALSEKFWEQFYKYQLKQRLLNKPEEVSQHGSESTYTEESSHQSSQLKRENIESTQLFFPQKNIETTPQVNPLNDKQWAVIGMFMIGIGISLLSGVQESFNSPLGFGIGTLTLGLDGIICGYLTHRWLNASLRENEPKKHKISASRNKDECSPTESLSILSSINGESQHNDGSSEPQKFSAPLRSGLGQRNNMTEKVKSIESNQKLQLQIQ